MRFVIRQMTDADFSSVAEIYQQGILGNLATFTEKVPPFDVWDKAHDKRCRLVDEENGCVAGFAVVSPHGGAYAYRGVGELSVYIHNAFQGRGIGEALVRALISQAEKAGYWTLESVITADNARSVRLHEKLGFRLVGRRERISYTPDGVWHDTLVYEWRSRVLHTDEPYRAPKTGVRLTFLEGEFCVCKPDAPIPLTARGVYFSAQTSDERSLLCRVEDAPDAQDKEAGFIGLRVAGQLDFSLIGILSGITAVLAAQRISVFVVSTFDTDYIFIKKTARQAALSALLAAGYEVDE